MKALKLFTMLIITLPLLLQGSTFSRAQSGANSNNLFNMSYLFFGALNTYVNQVNQTKGSLTAVSPSYFDINETGNLDVTWRLQTSFITEMHKRGIKVTPFLSNHWDRTAGINGLNNRDKLAKDIAAAIVKYDLDGVNVDIEGISHSYRDAHTDLVRLLRQYLPSNKEVSVAVAANPNGWSTGWHGFYDYKMLAKHADYLMIMAYDESWESPDSPVGPVSSLSFFEKSIQYAVNQGIPREKIVSGLPFYGRMWKLDGPTLENRSITGMGVSSTRVKPLVTKFNGRITFDEKTKSPYASFSIPKDQYYFIGNTKLTEGNYLIWFENEQSIKAKLSLPLKYGIKGTGSWALGHETPETWDYYTVALNNGGNQYVQSVFDSGLIGLLTAVNVNFRETASTSGRTLGTLSGDKPVKITGPTISAENYNWYPAQLSDGTKGYIAANYVEVFNLTELHGPTRYETGVKISSSGWKEGSGVAVIGRGDIPVDALTGSVLAKKHKAPLLLTNATSLPEQVSTELERLKPTTIYILGGTGAVSSAIENQLVQKGYTVKRVAGASRYDTAVNVAEEVGINGELIIATGETSPDALSIGPYAGIRQTPIVYSTLHILPTGVINLIKTHQVKKVTIVGGAGVVSEHVVSALKELGVQTVERVSGINRYETSIAIAKRFKSELNLNKLFFASGFSFIDALPGSPLAAISASPIILVNNEPQLQSSISDFLKNELTSTPDVTILGGYGIIPYDKRATIFQAIK